jgi:pyocin large subunit-like protein
MVVVDSAMPDMTAWTGRNLVWNLSEPQDVRCGARSNRKGPTCVRRASDE